ncbi:Nucleotide exchange factor SIL1 [Thelohanellus kitauei]|uniref:Nucleotide exchange factor SIL1 n=1 Tax=Thelohanellus kitauei TaxID=669202 RepID=A0A0C2MXD8_THEKT|nr:Nucleotide exchange factor SIL1 [Thelohanellus kitauei]
MLSFGGLATVHILSLAYLICEIYALGSDFVLTNEWKEVVGDEPVPGGNLHVRMDLSTGKRYAKLIDDEKTTFDKSIKVLDEFRVDTHTDTDPPYKFKNIEEIKKDLDSVFSKFESEHTILVRLVAGLQNNSNNAENKLRTLNDLEPILHGFDNAKLFVQVGGFEIVLEMLKTTELNDMCLPVMRILFACLQNNQEVQSYFYAIEGTKFLVNLSNDLHALPQNCLGKMASVVSASMRGCSTCLQQFARVDSSLFSKLVDVPDEKVRTKLVGMLTSFYHESKASHTPEINDIIQGLITESKLCQKTSDFRSRYGSQDNSESDTYKSAVMLHHFCGHFTTKQ